MTLQDQFGNLDIYLFDQLLRGNIQPGMTIFDAGFGGGRNIYYFLREGYEVHGNDVNPEAVSAIRRWAPNPGRFRCEALEALTFPPAIADVVISCAVLHFAADDTQFAAMLEGSWKMLKRGGLFFCRLATSIGMEGQVIPLGGNRFALPDGSDRYLASEETLMRWTAKLGGDFVDPLKTTVVQGQRAMTTWVIRKH